MRTMSAFTFDGPFRGGRMSSTYVVVEEIAFVVAAAVELEDAAPWLFNYQRGVLWRSLVQTYALVQLARESRKRNGIGERIVAL